ncbi:MAG: vitamin K epoxide reductase family protein [Candidatus Babeliales bacterium]
MIYILILAAIGFFISLYAYFIEKKIQHEPLYKPTCDISDKISCSKPILSKYGKLFYFSNSFIGMIFYIFIFIAAYLGYSTTVFYGSLVSVIISLILAYILYFKIQTLCILCTAIYIINALIFIISYMNINK